MKATRCTVCAHDQLAEINRRLCGTSAPNYSQIARAFHVDHEAVARHYRSHLPALLVKAGNLADVASAEWIVQVITTAYDELKGVIERSKLKGDERSVTMAVKAQTSLVTTVTAAAATMEEMRSKTVDVSARDVVSLDDVERVLRARIDGEVASRLAIAQHLDGSAIPRPDLLAQRVDLSTQRVAVAPGPSAPGAADPPADGAAGAA